MNDSYGEVNGIGFLVVVCVCLVVGFIAGSFKADLVWKESCIKAKVGTYHPETAQFQFIEVKE